MYLVCFHFSCRVTFKMHGPQKTHVSLEEGAQAMYDNALKDVLGKALSENSHGA